MPRRTVMHCLYGSRLFGTHTAASDVDVRGVYIACGRTLLLGAPDRTAPVEEGVLALAQARFGAATAQKGAEGDRFSLPVFLALAGEGNLVALEMLFAPDEALLGAVDPLWARLVAGRERLLSRNAAAFLGYMRAQSSLYRRKGDRLEAVQSALAWARATLEAGPEGMRLGAAKDALEAFVARTAHTALLPPDAAAGRSGQTTGMLEVCDRRMHLSCKVSALVELLERLEGRYGERSRAAALAPGHADLKAVGHALRIAHQAQEFFTEGRISFPRPEAALVRRVRAGAIAFEAAVDMMEEAFARAEAAAAASALPETPDQAFVEEMLVEAHGVQVRETMGL